MEGHCTVSHCKHAIIRNVYFFKSTVRMERRHARVNYQLEFYNDGNIFFKIGMEVELKHCFAFFTDANYSWLSVAFQTVILRLWP